MTISEAHKFLSEYVTKNYGKHCLDFCLDCNTCHKWLAVEQVEDMARDEEAESDMMS